MAALPARNFLGDLMPETIHIRCGDDIQEGLALAGYDGAFLEWSDPVCQGPVPKPKADNGYFDARARFISDAWGYSFDETHKKLTSQTAGLNDLDGYDRVMLWFEHDLFDQAILLRLCASLKEMPQVHDRLYTQTTDQFPGIDRFLGFGQLSPDQLATLKGQETRVRPEMLDFAERAWRAFCAPEPLALVQVMDDRDPGFPYLSAALQRFFQEYPWTCDGLSLTERLCLRAIAGGAAKAGHVFRDVYINREPQPFMGDIMFKAILMGLADADTPAVTAFDDWQDPIALTPFGEKLLAGQGDWVTENGIDRWFGGVHLTGRSSAWRWDGDLGRLVATG